MMKILIVTRYRDVVKEIINEDIDNFTLSEHGKTTLDLIYELKNDNLYVEYESWLQHAKSCGLVRNFRIER